MNLFQEEDAKCFQFKKSPPLSVYLYSIIAGPYQLIESEQPDILNYKVPLRYFSRRSIAKYVELNKEVYFHLTKCGIDFYESIF